MSTSEFRKQLSQFQVERTVLITTLGRVTKELKETQDNKLQSETARTVLQKSIKLVQENLAVHLSELVTEALSTIFVEDPYELRLKFIERRNNTECDLVFIKNGVEQDPLESSGFGAVDVASFILRMAYLMLTKGRKLLVFDEPFKNLDKSKHEVTGNVIAKLSKELGVQIIMVTHEIKFAKAADKIFRVSQYKGTSSVKEVII